MIKVGTKLYPSKIMFFLAIAMMMAIFGLFADRTETKAVVTRCNVLLIIDRSGSTADVAGGSTWNKYRQAINTIFKPRNQGGIDDTRVFVSFWTFSHEDNSNGSNFNQFYQKNPYYVPVKNSGGLPGLASVTAIGATNYEQAFGYNNGVFNSNSDINNIANYANILVFITDGLPNRPIRAVNDQRNIDIAIDRLSKLINPQTGAAKNVNREKALLGVLVEGNYTGDLVALKKIIPNSQSATQESLSVQLKKIIPIACDDITGEYSLTPKVQPTQQGGFSVRLSNPFNYFVNNTGVAATSAYTNWTVKRLIVKPSTNICSVVQPGIVAACPGASSLKYLNDSGSCGDLVSRLGGAGNFVDRTNPCVEVASGEGQFNRGDSFFPSSAAINVDPRWDTGTKVCDVLTIERPTENPNSPKNRYSYAYCLEYVGPQSVFQVRGSDIYVGRHFLGSNISSTTAGIKVPAPGSWAEYGVFTTGDVTNFASGAAYNQTGSGAHPLTFANANSSYGSFISDQSKWTIPDVESSIKSGKYDSYTTINPGPSNRNLLLLDNLGPDKYKYESNQDLALGADRPLQAGTKIVIYAPDQLVTIKKDIKYPDGPIDSDKIPQLVIIAKNINIESAVRRVDAWLIAKGGTLNTCSNGACDTNQLSINGPVMSEKISLNRTFYDNSSSPQNPAELFNLPASTYLYLMDKKSNDSGNKPLFETSWSVELPPYF